MSEPGSHPDVSRSIEEIIAIAQADLKLTPELAKKIKDHADPHIVEMCMEHFGRKAIEDIATIQDERVKRKHLASAPDKIRYAISNDGGYTQSDTGSYGISSRRKGSRRRDMLGSLSWDSLEREGRAQNAGVVSFAIGSGKWWNLIADVRREERVPFGEGDEQIHDEFRQGIPGAYKPIQQYLGEDPKFLSHLRKEIESRKEELEKLWQRNPDLVLREIDNTAQENGYKWDIGANQYEKTGV